MSSSVEGICTEGNSSSTSTIVGFLDHFHSSYSCKPWGRGREGGESCRIHLFQVPRVVSHKAKLGGSEGALSPAQGSGLSLTHCGMKMPWLGL